VRLQFLVLLLAGSLLSGCPSADDDDLTTDDDDDAADDDDATDDDDAAEDPALDLAEEVARGLMGEVLAELGARRTRPPDGDSAASRILQEGRPSWVRAITAAPNRQAEDIRRLRGSADQSCPISSSME
jgi:hypothetical protein